MLFLTFSMGNDRYAIDAAQIVEILPLVTWKSLPGAPPGVAGIIDYRGSPAPLLDLSELVLGTPCRKWMSTRIVVINHADTDTPGLLGLLAEGATDTIRRDEEDFLPPGLTTDAAPYLGPIANTAEGPVQQIHIRHLLPGHIRNLLFVNSSERRNGL
jgi:chemotaxis-related protein WspB